MSEQVKVESCHALRLAHDYVLTTYLPAHLTQALIEPFLKQFKENIDAVIVDGEYADVKQPASTFVKHAGQAVSVQLVASETGTEHSSTSRYSANL